ncbi:MAG: HD domain-containing protein [Clostridia bacterium]|nr:HD domain-containing protein [Clostridia bacterium]
MDMTKKITFNDVKGCVDVFTRLNCLRRWTDFATQQKYNELSKQALNTMIAFFIANTEEHAGKSICYEQFPKIAINRAFTKVYVYYDTPEHKLNEICEISGISKKEFQRVTVSIIAEKTDENFAEFISHGIGEYESRIYQAATKIATYIELLEQKNCSNEFVKFQEIERSLEAYRDIPAVREFTNTESAFFKLFQKLSKLRNQNRWATCCYNIECSVLGHLFDTAVFAYLMALDERDFDEEYATRMFFMGIFHDVAEVWTKDIPSPIKDKIPGFRKATEQYEEEMLKKYLYSVVPEYLADALKAVMFEDESNAAYKKKVKEADYLSADCECYRNLVAGTRDTYFVGAISRTLNDDATDLYVEVHKYFEDYAKKLNM